MRHVTMEISSICKSIKPKWSPCFSSFLLINKKLFITNFAMAASYRTGDEGLTIILSPCCNQWCNYCSCLHNWFYEKPLCAAKLPILKITPPHKIADKSKRPYPKLILVSFYSENFFFTQYNNNKTQSQWAILFIYKI